MHELTAVDQKRPKTGWEIARNPKLKHRISPEHE